MRVLMSGGGTAGHVYPALTVAGRFADAPDEVLFVGTPDGLEARLVPEAGVAFRVWAPHADAVYVTGSFNDWSTGSHPMLPTRTTSWVFRRRERGDCG